MASFHVLKIRNVDQPDEMPLTLTFTSRKLYDEVQTRVILQKSPRLEIVDSGHYKLFTDADDAMHVVNVFCRDKKLMQHANILADCVTAVPVVRT